MQEKLYKLVRGTGILGVVCGIVWIVSGVAGGVLLIISGSKLLSGKSKILY